MAAVRLPFWAWLRDLITQRKRRERKLKTKMQYDFTFAASRGDTKLVEKLLDAGCDVNEPCWTGSLALHEACSNADKAIVELLLEHGAKPDLTTKTRAKEGLTALHYAASGCRNRWAGKAPEAEPPENAKECMEILIEHGAAVDARNISQRTPLHLAVMVPSHDAEGVRKYYVNGVGESRWETHALPRVDLLLRHGADINAKDSEGRTPFHYAAMAGDKRTRLLTRLRAAGANETTRDYQGNRAYECAKEDVIKRFIEPEDARLKREAHEEYIRRTNEEFDRRCQEHFEETGEYYWFTPDGD